MHRDPKTSSQATKPTGPPTNHELAVMVWLCVFPTLTVLNLVLADWLITLAPALRTFVLATIAVPFIVYALMPMLNRLRVRLRTRRSPARRTAGPGLSGRRPAAAGRGL